jgi:hypothetical protein
MVADLARAVVFVLAHPVEAADRARGRVALRRREVASHDYDTDPDWERRAHELLGRPWPCEEHEAFEEVWEHVRSKLPEVGEGHDADPALARAAWCLVRHLQPRRVIETGVARGMLTRVMLEALDRNGSGHLWSIDLPPVVGTWRRHVALAMGSFRHPRWTFLRGASRRKLEPLIHELREVDLFVHDSLHTEENVRFELTTTWAALVPGGAVLADDIQENAAFEEFARSAAPGRMVVGAAESKPATFGIAIKASDVAP